MQLSIGGRPCTEEELRPDATGLSPLQRRLAQEAPAAAHLQELAAFIALFLGPEDSLELQTSGSTGTPQLMLARKEHMLRSAGRTIAYLGLRPGDRALLCMPLKYIAARMMVVRALAADLDLIAVPPSRNPYLALDDTARPDFSAITPMQAVCAAADARSRARMFEVRHTIIGGGALPQELAAELQQAPGRFYASYGMTETLSHIALQPLNGPRRSSSLQLLEGIEAELSGEGALVIHAPDLGQAELHTRDLAVFDGPRSFRILGRLDNVINSGGIKLHIEDIERKLSSVLSGDFAVGWRSSPLYGQEAVLVLTTAQRVSEEMLSVLERYERPKHIIRTEHIPRTPTDKPSRPAIQALIREHFARQPS